MVNFNKNNSMKITEQVMKYINSFFSAWVMGVILILSFMIRVINTTIYCTNQIALKTRLY